LKPKTQVRGLPIHKLDFSCSYFSLSFFVFYAEALFLYSFFHYLKNSIILISVKIYTKVFCHF